MLKCFRFPLLVAAAAASVACTHSQRIERSGAIVRLAATPEGSESIYLTALAIGRLEDHEGCLKLRSERGDLATVAWPNHFISVRRAGVLGVLDPSSGRTVFANEAVRLPGGAVELAANFDDRDLALRCGGPFLSADEI